MLQRPTHICRSKRHFMALLFLSTVSVTSSPATREPAAHVVSLNGRAIVGKHELRPGDPVFPGDVITTQQASSLKLLTADKSILDVGPSTTFKLEEFTSQPESDSLTTRLDWGRVRASIHKRLERKKKFYIRTKSSVLAVRGTEFVVEERNGLSPDEKMTVGEGSVERSPISDEIKDTENQDKENSNGPETPTSVWANQQWRLELLPTKKATVTPLEPKTTAKIVSEATVEDDTFRQLVVPGDRMSIGRQRHFEGSATLNLVSTTLTLPLDIPTDWDPTPSMESPFYPSKHLQVPYLSELSPDIASGKTVELKVIFNK